MDGPISVQLTAVEGPMARRIADLRAALEVMAGHSWRDPWTAPAPLHAAELEDRLGIITPVDPR